MNKKKAMAFLLVSVMAVSMLVAEAITRPAQMTDLPRAQTAAIRTAIR